MKLYYSENTLTLSIRLIFVFITSLGISAVTFAGGGGGTHNIGSGNMTTCSATIYDKGGTSDYSNNEYEVETYCSSNGDCAQITFSAFSTESCCDHLKIYDGANTSAPLIGTYNGTTSPGTVTSSTGCLTFEWTSDFSSVSSGWVADISCTACPSCTDGIQNGTETDVDCGGTCAPCPCSDYDEPCCATPLTVNSDLTCGTVGSGNTGDGTSSGISACTGTADDDVWFSFVATSTEHEISLLNVASSEDMVHEVFSGTCGLLTSISCSDPDKSTVTGLTVNDTYYVRVYTYYSAQPNTSFDICIGTPPPPPSPGVACYTETTPAFNFYGKMGTNITFPDDQFDIVRNIGFDFCFMGNTYTQYVVSSNGYVTFETSLSGTNSDYTPEAIPSTNGDVLASILGPWHDIDPNVGGRIRTTTLGTAPNRSTVVTFDAVPMFSCTTINETHEIIFYETSNVIDINLEKKDVCAGWVGGRATLGLNGPYGLVAVPGAGRNNTVWTQTNETVRFTPTCDVCTPVAPVMAIFKESFVGENKGKLNLLYWATDGSEQIKEFLVERSSDGIIYMQTGNIRAIPGKKDYAFTDFSAPQGLSYYRVREVMKDDLFSYTRAISLSVSESLEPLVYPNPVKDIIHLDFELDHIHNQYTIELVDFNGKVIRTIKGFGSEGKTSATIDVKDLPGGIYFYKLSANDMIYRGKLLIE